MTIPCTALTHPTNSLEFEGITSCAPAHPSLCSQSAPEKRQYKRSTVPDSDGIFMPEIRPDFGRCKSVPAMLGLAGCTLRKDVRRSLSRFLRPASSRHPAGSPLN